ncbi:MAG: SCP2 sterol-binding domain-containing protein [Anaerolineae bacterium]|nr:SCP2 sterol-binding domain-containing protein [Anaerolineae bacterium]
MAVTSVQDVIQRITGLDPSRLAGFSGVVLFDLSGEGGGRWTLTFGEGTVKVEEGQTAPPNVTLAMSAADFVAMANGQLNPVSAFMQGKIRVTGDMGLAMRLQSILT